MLRRSLLSLALLSPVFPAAAQGYPTRPIKVYHGFAAGGPPDTALRRIGSVVEAQLGQPLVVENRPGASGTIAASFVAHAEPDGYTLLFGVAANLAVGPATARNPPYDPTIAFAPIVEVARGPYLWLVNASSPARSMQDFVLLARQQPGRLNYGSPGVGSVHHLATETLAREVRIVLTHVPYATGGLYPAILSNQVDCMFESMPGPLPYLKSGKLRALAVTGASRLAALPDVPTLAEQRLPDPQASSWWGFVGPRGLASPLVQKLNRDITAALLQPDVLASFRAMAIEPSPGSPEQFGSYIASQYKHWREQARSLGIELS